MLKYILIYSTSTEAAMSILKFSVGDILVLKKKHPCDSHNFMVLRMGSDVRIVCCGCGRDMTMPRETLDKAIKKIIPSAEINKKDGN